MFLNTLDTCYQKLYMYNQTEKQAKTKSKVTGEKIVLSRFPSQHVHRLLLFILYSFRRNNALFPFKEKFCHRKVLF